MKGYSSHGLPFKGGTLAFTLVELIVVVTILAILATVGFVSYSGYLTGVRDTNRQSQLVAIHDGLELYSTDMTLPLPEDYVRIENGGETIGYQGYAGKKVLSKIDFTKGGIDPKDKNYFSYYLSKNRKQFQLMAFLEENTTLETGLTEVKAGASDYSSRFATVYGDQLGTIIESISKTPIQEETTIAAAGVLDIGATTNDYILMFRDDYRVEGTGGTLGQFIGLAENCKDIKSTGNFGDGTYMIKPTGAENYFEVYCDMTTKGNARTRFVNIKGDYSMTDTRNCWGGQVVFSTELDCFNPNKHEYKAVELMVKTGGSSYFFKPRNGTPTTISEKKSGVGGTTYYCYGGHDYMTAMKAGAYPLADGSDGDRIRLGRSFCGESNREIGGKRSNDMMYYNHSETSFGPTQVGSARFTNVVASEIFIR